MIVAIFAILAFLGDNAKYAWFFITYTLLNAGFYTANNICHKGADRAEAPKENR